MAAAEIYKSKTESFFVKVTSRYDGKVTVIYSHFSKDGTFDGGTKFTSVLDEKKFDESIQNGKYARVTGE